MNRSPNAASAAASAMISARMALRGGGGKCEGGAPGCDWASACIVAVAVMVARSLFELSSAGGVACVREMSCESRSCVAEW